MQASNPYTPQQFFDQPANITNGQLLAMNPKFGLTIARQLRKPVAKKTDVNKQEGVSNNQQNEMSIDDNDNIHLHADMEKNKNKSTALYCEASIKNIQFPLIVDSGSAGSIMSLTLLKDLD